MEKYGFVYIWRDRKNNRYYVGCHWGYEDDGYVCSSTWMMQSYKKRPHDFKRRILSRGVYTRDSLLNEEFKFLSMIQTQELGKKYYNLKNTKDYYWHTNNSRRLTIAEKISIKTKEAMARPDVREKLEKQYDAIRGKKQPKELVEKRRQTMIKTMAEKFPEENRKKLLTKEERTEYYSNKAKLMRQNRSEEQKIEIGNKIAKANLGKKMRLGQTNSDEHRRKISEAHKGKIHIRHKISIDGIEYESTHKAADTLSISTATINRRLKSDKYPQYLRVGL